MLMWFIWKWCNWEPSGIDAGIYVILLLNSSLHHQVHSPLGQRTQGTVQSRSCCPHQNYSCEQFVNNIQIHWDFFYQSIRCNQSNFGPMIFAESKELSLLCLRDPFEHLPSFLKCRTENVTRAALYSSLLRVLMCWSSMSVLQKSFIAIHLCLWLGV